MDTTNTRPKRNNPRRAAKDRWEEEKLMTSDTSQLIDLDLVRLLALPDAWNCLEEAEKEEILSLLPSDTHPNPIPPADDPDAKIPPLPEQFLRYSNHWRDAIRHFQLDLQNGHYDPRWLREAEEAMQQRAAGQFDKFKEQEFEEFWGQKQRMDKSLAAGQSSQVRLRTLIEHGVIRKGDVWKLSRAFSRGRRRLLVEKEARIIEINGPRLTFVVPPGQRVFLKSAPTPDAENSMTAETPATEKPTVEEPTVEEPITDLTTPPSSPPKDTPIIDTVADSETKDAAEAGSSRKRSAEPELEEKVAKRPRGHPRKQKPAAIESKASNLAVEVPPHQPATTETISPPVNTQEETESTAELENGHPNSDEQTATEQPEGKASVVVESADEKSPPSPPANTDEETDEIIIRDVNGPTALSLKILEIDGRVKEIPNGNAWKEIRCYRDNQDMGTLWEVRQAWYLRGK